MTDTNEDSSGSFEDIPPVTQPKAPRAKPRRSKLLKDIETIAKLCFWIIGLVVVVVAIVMAGIKVWTTQDDLKKNTASISEKLDKHDIRSDSSFRSLDHLYKNQALDTIRK